ncbi:MAG TPA: hypothetical protein VFF27_01135 [Bacteroidia bacterium]|jgi:cytochrome c oxidase subunit 1|nr:hypothetical protein [Bacteroidia bacterium]
MKLVKRLDILFPLTGLLLCVPFLLLGDQALDIAIHDTYIIIAYAHIGILFFLIHTLYGLIYFLIRKNQNYKLGIWHLLLQTPLFIYFIPQAYRFFSMAGVTRRYYTTDPYPTLQIFASIAIVAVFLFIIGHIVFLINIISSIVKAIKAG